MLIDDIVMSVSSRYYANQEKKRVACLPLDRMLYQLLSGPGWQAKKKKSNTIPCLGQVLTCLGQRQVKLHTLFRTARPKNHTLSSGTSPYSPNKGVPPPPPGDRGMIENFLLVSGFYQSRFRHAMISFKEAGASHFLPRRERPLLAGKAVRGSF